MNFLSNRLVALAKFLAAEGFKADARLRIRPDIGMVQVGASAAVNVDQVTLGPGLWRITGHATIAGAIAVGNALWQYGLLDLAAPVPSVFPLASWRTLAGIQVAQNFRIAITLLLSQPWQVRHAAPATAAGDTLAMRANLLYSRLT